MRRGARWMLATGWIWSIPLLGAPLLGAETASLEEARSQAGRTAVEQVLPSVVRVEISGAGDARQSLAGTGVVVASDGWLVTTSVLVDPRPAGILVVTPTGEKLTARLAGVDHLRHIALLKVESSGLSMPVATPADEINVGQSVWGVGKGLSVTHLSSGIISAKGRMWGRAVQTDAKISPANQGGPLVDLRGRVVGVITIPDAGVLVKGSAQPGYDSGVGFAVPMVDILSVLDRLKEGDLRPGLLGMTFRDGSQLLSSPVIDRVSWRGPAYRADLRPGDRIVDVDGSPIERRIDLLNRLGTATAGTTVKVLVQREDEQLSANLTLVDRLPFYRWPMLGARVVESGEGLQVVDVIPQMPAAGAKWERGTLLLSADGQKLAKVADLRSRLDPRAPGETVTVRVNQGGRTFDSNLTLAPFPASLPADFAPAESPQEEKLPDWSELEVEGGGAKYSALIPADASRPHGLVLAWTGAQTPTAATYRSRWGAACQRRGIVFAVVRAQSPSKWGPVDIANGRAVLDDIRRRLTIDPDRVVLHAAQGSIPMALGLLDRERTVVRGLILTGAIPRLPPTDPTAKLAVAAAWGKSDPRAAAHQSALRALAELGYPAWGESSEEMTTSYPSQEVVDRWSLWITLLGYL